MRNMWEHTKSRSWKKCDQKTSVGYIFPRSPLTPRWGHQRISGAGPEHADLLWYQRRQRAYGLKSNRNRSQSTKYDRKNMKQPWNPRLWFSVWSFLPFHCLWARIQSRAPDWRSCEESTSWTVARCWHSASTAAPQSWQSGGCQVQLQRCKTKAKA